MLSFIYFFRYKNIFLTIVFFVVSFSFIINLLWTSSTCYTALKITKSKKISDFHVKRKYFFIHSVCTCVVDFFNNIFCYTTYISWILFANISWACEMQIIIIKLLMDEWSSSVIVKRITAKKMKKISVNKLIIEIAQKYCWLNIIIVSVIFVCLFYNFFSSFFANYTF